MKEGRSRMVVVGTGPLQPTEVIEPIVRHAGVHRGQDAEFVPDRFSIALRPVVAERIGEHRDDFVVILCLSWWIEGLADTLHAALGRCHSSIGFRPASCRREDDIGHRCGLCEEDVLDHEMVESFKEAYRSADVGL